MPSPPLKVDYKSSEGPIATFVFRVRRCHRAKRDFGGYTDNFRGATLLNYYSQTDQPLAPATIMFERDTQMLEVTTKSVTAAREFGSQTADPSSLFFDSRSDRIIYPGKYFDSVLWGKRRTEASIFIQKMIRGCLARMRIAKIKSLTQKITTEKQTTLAKQLEEAEAAKQAEYQRRIHPRVG
jgi:hypothetical protein